MGIITKSTWSLTFAISYPPMRELRLPWSSRFIWPLLLSPNWELKLKGILSICRWFRWRRGIRRGSGDRSHTSIAQNIELVDMRGNKEFLEIKEWKGFCSVINQRKLFKQASFLLLSIGHMSSGPLYKIRSIPVSPFTCKISKNVLFYFFLSIPLTLSCFPFLFSSAVLSSFTQYAQRLPSMYHHHPVHTVYPPEDILYRVSVLWTLNRCLSCPAFTLPSVANISKCRQSSCIAWQPTCTLPILLSSCSLRETNHWSVSIDRCHISLSPDSPPPPPRPSRINNIIDIYLQQRSQVIVAFWIYR